MLLDKSQGLPSGLIYYKTNNKLNFKSLLDKNFIEKVLNKISEIITSYK
jgi:hypothetical protein